MPGFFRRGIFALAAFAMMAFCTLPLGAAEPIPNDKCMECHGQQDLDKKDAQGRVVSLYVDEAKMGGSVHKRVSCSSCHSDLTLDHPDNNVAPKHVDCGACHQKQEEAYAASIHGVSRTMGASGAASCADCHGHHYILPIGDRQSPVFKLNLPSTCARCHSNPGLNQEYRLKYPQVASQYQESIHGKALLGMGLIVAPSCNDCHGVHDIKRSVDRSSPVNKTHVAATCGKCHFGVEETYNKSVHGQLLAKGDPRGPVCTDCHTAHQIEHPGNGHFKSLSDQRCGRCHQDRLEHYRETYHGKAMALGRPNVASEVAACYDCHGFHDVLPPSDPASHLSSANIVHTCQRCHPGANTGFTKYLPHANPLDARNYPGLHAVFLAMTGLLVGVFTFFGAHTLLWLIRSLYLYLHDSRKFREAKVDTQKDGEWFTRFVPIERFLHFLVVSSFLLLVITGMPLKFYYTGWAREVFHVIGGAEVARALHRLGALITFLYFTIHLGALVAGAWHNRRGLRNPESGKIELSRLRKIIFGPESMMPNLQDWRDFVAHQKWFFGRGIKPQFDRWTYWEKFDYFAVFWGVFAIGLSGLVMWFPEFFCRFLPGWIINVALIVHSDEALLAAGFIFTIHFFNTHFRLEKFPMDTVIFSGRISKTEMIHERKRWYDRLVAEGRLDRHRVRDEWESWKNIARPMGYLFFSIGLILLFMILFAMFTRLAH